MTSKLSRGEKICAPQAPRLRNFSGITISTGRFKVYRIDCRQAVGVTTRRHVLVTARYSFHSDRRSLRSLTVLSQYTSPYIKVCQRDDPNVDRCIMNSVEELRPKMIADRRKVACWFMSASGTVIDKYPLRYLCHDPLAGSVEQSTTKWL
ncbi:hypothetical protein EVAR_69841_1 [Eumeta japonica]|uniref:Uncharacterized protein n=1 Tax=Eumeta variegata TaxID=151549 RepID=A0A4C1ZYY8_EUMVA|nr:hypothetical protein EVAR_69841_1 [Eumeta japonica]